MVDLYNSDKEVLSYNQIIRKFGPCITFIESYGLLEAIPKYCKVKKSGIHMKTFIKAQPPPSYIVFSMD